MSAVRQLKRTFFRRQWFSPNYMINGVVHPMQRHGLRFDDIRSQQGVRRAYPGMMELIDVPYDEIHHTRLCHKREEQAFDQRINRDVRQIRQVREKPMKHRSFRLDKRIHITETCKKRRAEPGGFSVSNSLSLLML